MVAKVQKYTKESKCGDVPLLRSIGPVGNAQAIVVVFFFFSIVFHFFSLFFTFLPHPPLFLPHPPLFSPLIFPPSCILYFEATQPIRQHQSCAVLLQGVEIGAGKKKWKKRGGWLKSEKLWRKSEKLW
jgi:hypothetical protein